MSAHTAGSDLSFQLPKLSYVDAKWEEPNLVAAPVRARKPGLAAWMSRQIAAFVAWRQERDALAELSAMSAHELQDIGLTRADLSRVFQPALCDDLRQRGY